MGSLVYTLPETDRLKNIHVFMVSFPGQGHVNPLLRLGKRLADFGLLVTFSAPESVRSANNIASDDPTPLGSGSIRFEFFDDGWAPDDPNRNDLGAYVAQLEIAGREQLTKMIRAHSAKARPVSYVINNPFIPWVSDVAEALGIPSAVLWIQSCACFSLYYHYHQDPGLFPTKEEPEKVVEIPFLPSLKHDEIPSFLHPNTPYPFLRDAILGQFENLSKPRCVLIDTFDDLEGDVIEHVSRVSRPVRAIGPLFKARPDSADEVRVDFHAPEDCREWLDARPARSVVYVSFGSIVQLEQEQVEELAHGLMLAGVAFLWVMRAAAPPQVLPEGFLERGRIVGWAAQEAVLGHGATGCFVTHCGWNSTVEAVASGVPVVAFPQWGDQVTDAKFLVDVFRVGVRMCRGEAEGRVVRREEVERCLRAAMEDGREMRDRAMRWKRAAEEAVAEGGSSYRNMEEFVYDMAGIGKSG